MDTLTINIHLREIVNGGQLVRLEIIYGHIPHANRRVGNLVPATLEVRSFIYLPPDIAPANEYATIRWGGYIFVNAVRQALDRIQQENEESRIAEGIEILDEYENRVRGADGTW